MACVLLGVIVGPDITVGSGTILGDPGGIARPGVPDVVSASATFLRPPIGYYATTVITPVPLVLTRSVVSNVNGHTVTLGLVNNFAPIFYTLDGSAPVNGVTASCFRYVGPVPVQFPTYPRDGSLINFKAKAFALAGGGFSDSLIDSFQLQIPQEPELSFQVKDVAALQRQVTIVPSFAGTFDIRFTVDGSMPTPLSPLYTVPFTLTGVLNSSILIRATAFPNAPIGLTGGVIPSDEDSITLQF